MPADWIETDGVIVDITADQFLEIAGCYGLIALGSSPRQLRTAITLDDI